MPFNKGKTDVVGQLQDGMDLADTHASVVPAAVAGTDYEVPVYVAPSGGSGTTLSRASLFAAVAVSATAATTAVTLKFRQYRAGSLVGDITGASSYATSATLAARTEKNLFSGALALSPGDLITLQTTHTGDGAALPILAAVVEASPSV